MATKPLPSPEVLRQLLRYEPETGKLFWRERTPDMFVGSEMWPADAQCRRWNTRFANQEAMATLNGGYKHGAIARRNYQAHRVIWALVYGEWPATDIDHINGDKSDNRLVNLRKATRPENMRNRGKTASNTSGFKGVTWAASLGCWKAQIKANYRSHHLGYFADPKDAHQAYLTAAARLHGEFAVQG